MTEQAPKPDAGDDTGAEFGESAPGIPRWLKLSGLVVAVLVLLLVVVMLFGGHTPPGVH